MAQFYDTMLAEYIKNPGRRGLGLDILARDHYNYEMISYKDVSEKGKLRFDEVALKDASIYSGEDVYITHKLYKDQKENPYISQSKVLREIELPLMEVLAKMEMTGIKIDRDILKGIGHQLEYAIKELEAEIFSLAGVEFNIKSPKQVGEILFDTMGIQAQKKTKTGYSVNAEVLEGLSKKYPIASLIIEYRHYSKLLSTYIDGLLDVTSENDRVHTSYNQTVTATGRLSSTNPNLQNIPSGEELAGEIRKAFIPDSPEDFIIAFDYSQIEVRLLALMSTDKNLLQAFKEGRDIHQVTGEFIFGKSDITSNERKKAKAVNFGVIYGISPFGLSKMIDIPGPQAKEYIDGFYKLYPGVRTFYDKVIADCKKNSYVETLFGRKRYIPSINDRNKMVASGAEREAINMPIQGTNADIIKIAMIDIQNMLDQGKYESTMLLQVHDELVFNFKSHEKEELSPKILHIMENILGDTEIPLKVDMGVGKNWKEAK